MPRTGHRDPGILLACRAAEAGRGATPLYDLQRMPPSVGVGALPGTSIGSVAPPMAAWVGPNPTITIDPHIDLDAPPVMR